MPRPLKRGILGASTIILSKDIDKYAFMYGLNFYETDVMYQIKIPIFYHNLTDKILSILKLYYARSSGLRKRKF
jgi:hypothetical protein